MACARGEGGLSSASGSVAPTLPSSPGLGCHPKHLLTYINACLVSAEFVRVVGWFSYLRTSPLIYPVKPE